MAERYIFWFEELGQGYGDMVGNKCANLGEIARLGLPIPPGFALSVDAYKDFMVETKAAEEIREYLQQFCKPINKIDQYNEVSRAIRQIVETKEMPALMKENILSNYSNLCRRCGCTDVAVATRSAGPQSHPGQYETYLNVKGESDLLDKIKKVWASSFNPRSIAFRSNKGLPLESDPIGVAVLKMVNARAAGVLFTADPNTGDSSKAIIEANWGLGESVVGGEVMPDVYIVDKENAQPLKKTLGKKTKYVAFKGTGVVETDTPPDRCSVFCLSDAEVKQIVELGKALEENFGVPQDVEWAVDQELDFPDNIILLQTRAEVIAQKQNPVDQVVDYMLRLF